VDTACLLLLLLLLTVILRGMEKQLSLAVKRRQVLQNASHIT
jgi:hypothetical protein